MLFSHGTDNMLSKAEKDSVFSSLDILRVKFRAHIRTVLHTKAHVLWNQFPLQQCFSTRNTLESAGTFLKHPSTTRESLLLLSPFPCLLVAFAKKISPIWTEAEWLPGAGCSRLWSLWTYATKMYLLPWSHLHLSFQLHHIHSCFSPTFFYPYSAPLVYIQRFWEARCKDHILSADLATGNPCGITPDLGATCVPISAKVSKWNLLFVPFFSHIKLVHVT